MLDTIESLISDFVDEFDFDNEDLPSDVAELFNTLGISVANDAEFTLGESDEDGVDIESSLSTEFSYDGIFFDIKFGVALDGYLTQDQPGDNSGFFGVTASAGGSIQFLGTEAVPFGPGEDFAGTGFTFENPLFNFFGDDVA
ncbi:MAG: hypothetical protein ACFBRM_08800 [Pikeienuella sp.]